MAGIIVKGNVTNAMTAQVFVEEMLGLARPQYNLRKLCRVFDLGNEIIAHIPIGTSLAGTEQVPENVEAGINAASFVDLDFECWKNVVHLVVSTEAELKSKFNIMQIQVQDGAKDLARMENKQIAAILAGLTDVSVGNWTSTGNPMDEIMPTVATLEINGFAPDVICMQSTVYAWFLANENIATIYPIGATAQQGGMVAYLGNLEIMRDAALASETAIIGDRKAPFCTLADGPAVVTEYEGGAKFNKGYAIAKFIQPQLAMTGAARELTGCLS